jgi:hypothetical protein
LTSIQLLALIRVGSVQAQFLMYDMEKPLLARRALLLTGMRKPSLDEKFVIFKSTKHLVLIIYNCAFTITITITSATTTTTTTTTTIMKSTNSLTNNVLSQQLH